MARKLVLACGLILIAAAGAISASADQLPILRSATVQRRHVVVRVAVSDLRPVQLIVAARAAVDRAGALLPANVRQRETIRLPAAAEGVVRWTSRKTLRPGIYFVQVRAVDTGGVTDCPVSLRPCLVHWSNVRRVVSAG